MYKLEAAETGEKKERETLTFMESKIYKDPSLGICCDFYIPCYCVFEVFYQI